MSLTIPTLPRNVRFFWVFSSDSVYNSWDTIWKTNGLGHMALSDFWQTYRARHMAYDNLEGRNVSQYPAKWYDKLISEPISCQKLEKLYCLPRINLRVFMIIFLPNCDCYLCLTVKRRLFFVFFFKVSRIYGHEYEQSLCHSQLLPCFLFYLSGESIRASHTP